MLLIKFKTDNPIYSRSFQSFNKNVMTKAEKQQTGANIFLYMRAIQRVLLSVAISAIAFLFIRGAQLGTLLTITSLWVVFALTFVVSSWVVFFKLPVNEIVVKANKEDGSRLFVMVSVIVSSFASLFTVLLLMISKNTAGKETITVILAIGGMMISWILVHTIFTFHYAHMFYSKEKGAGAVKAGLDFPGNDKPDYLDFAYFSFVLGMTFQVSDVTISAPLIRRTALAHGLLSFALNTFVVALTINLIAGLKN